eukprot:scaffold5222_cov282-Chaetoceros_neogracile.AAC.2
MTQQYKDEVNDDERSYHDHQEQDYPQYAIDEAHQMLPETSFSDEKSHTTDEEEYDTAQPLVSDIEKHLNDGGIHHDCDYVEAQVCEDKVPVARRHPLFACSCVVLLVVCLGGLAGGLFFGFTRAKVIPTNSDTSKNGTVAENDSSQDADTSKNGTVAENDSSLDADIAGFQEVVINDSRNSIGIINGGMFRSLENQPLPATLPIFDPATVGMYPSCSKLKEGIQNALFLIANEEILVHADVNYTASYYNYPVMMEDTDNDASDNTKDDSSLSEDSYGTNNQVTNVDEADIVKSSSQHVFVAYGDQLVVWEVSTGNKLSITKMNAHGDQTRSQSRIFLGPQRVQIRALMLNGNRLLVIVDGHDHDDDTPRILQGRGKTMIYVYNVNVSDIPTNGDALLLLSSKEVHGEYHDARMVGDTVHLVTMAKVDFYYHLKRLLRRGRTRFKDLNSTEYLENAISYTGALLVPSFIERIMDELKLDSDDSCKDIVQLSVLRTAEDETKVPSAGTIMHGFIEVISFDMHGNHNLTGFESKTLGSFTADVAAVHGSIMYASSETLVIANRGYKFDSSKESWSQNTFITSFSISDSYLSGVKILGAAQLPGYLLNQYSIDIWDGHLRLATTVDSRWGCGHDDENDPGHEICIWQMLEDSDNFISIYEVPSDGQADTMMHRVGFLSGLGEEQESIKSVRFMKDKGWLVTFVRTDPLYALDLSDHTSPEVKGILKVTGYSNYLHPYDDEGDYIIGVGQDADKDGLATGLQISLYNVADLSNPRLEDRYNVEEEDSIISSSSAQHDPKAFRFLSNSKNLIIPTTSQDIESGETFDGFNVFHVSKSEGIDFSFSIQHIDKENKSSSCWYNAYLRPRSLVHANTVTTMKGHSVLAHDLSTKEMKWILHLDSDNTDCKEDADGDQGNLHELFNNV